MGRSSILIISLLLSLDYGIRVTNYFNMARVVLDTILCRLSFHGNEEDDDVHFFKAASWDTVY